MKWVELIENQIEIYTNERRGWFRKNIFTSSDYILELIKFKNRRISFKDQNRVLVDLILFQLQYENKLPKGSASAKTFNELNKSIDKKLYDLIKINYAYLDAEKVDEPYSELIFSLQALDVCQINNKYNYLNKNIIKPLAHLFSHHKKGDTLSSNHKALVVAFLKSANKLKNEDHLLLEYRNFKLLPSFLQTPENFKKILTVPFTPLNDISFMLDLRDALEWLGDDGLAQKRFDLMMENWQELKFLTNFSKRRVFIRYEKSNFSAMIDFLDAHIGSVLLYLQKNDFSNVYSEFDKNEIRIICNIIFNLTIYGTNVMEPIINILSSDKKLSEKMSQIFQFITDNKKMSDDEKLSFYQLFDDPESNYLLGMFYLEKFQINVAVEYFEKSHNLASKKELFRIYNAESLHEGNIYNPQAFAETRHLAEDILKQDPDFHEAKNLLESRQHYGKSKKLDKKFITSVYQPDKSSKLFDETYKNDNLPRNVKLAFFYDKKNDHPDLQNKFDKAFGLSTYVKK